MAATLKAAERPLPQPDAVSSEFWSGLTEGVLRLQHCAVCDRHQFYPRPLCRSCGGDVTWTRASGTGVVHTFTIVRANPSEPFSSLVPYVLAVVELDEGPRMTTNIIDCHVDQVHIGMSVELAPEAAADDVVLPFFRPRS